MTTTTASISITTVTPAISPPVNPAGIDVHVHNHTIVTWQTVANNMDVYSLANNYCRQEPHDIAHTMGGGIKDWKR